MIAFRGLFRTTNPVFYYAVFGPMTGVSMVLMAIAAWRDVTRRRKVLGGWGCIALAVMLSLHIIARLNVRSSSGRCRTTQLRPPPWCWG
jgi:hypothetical protein